MDIWNVETVMMIAYKADSNFAFLSLIFAAYMEWIRSISYPVQIIEYMELWRKLLIKHAQVLLSGIWFFAAKMTWIKTNISFSVIHQI